MAGRGIDPAALARAERAIEAMAGSYLEAAVNDVLRLQAAVAAARCHPEHADALAQVREIGHEVRGQGGSFGFDLVSRIGTSLYRLVRERPVLPLSAYPVLDAHIDALRAVIAEGVKGDGSALGQQLARGLELTVDRLVGEPH